MARDLKLAFTFGADVVSGAGVLATTRSTPTGDKPNSACSIGTIVASGTAAPATSATLTLGFRNSVQNTSTFAEWLAGNEVTAIANDPPILGNTSPAEMYCRGVLRYAFGATPNFVVAANPSLVVQGAFDNGTGSPVAPTWSNISAPFPLLEYSTSAITGLTNVATPVATVDAGHGLRNGDYIVLAAAGGYSGTVVADRVYRVGSVTATTFNLLTAAGGAPGAPTGTFTGPVNFYKLRSVNANAVGGGVLFSVPLVETVRPHMRWAFVYPTTGTSGTMTLEVSKIGLVTGRESSASF